jgi:hypothetical protein
VQKNASSGISSARSSPHTISTSVGGLRRLIPQLPLCSLGRVVPTLALHHDVLTELHAHAEVDVLTSDRMMRNSPEVQWKHYREITAAHMQAALAKARIRVPKEGVVVPFDQAKVIG